MMMKGLLSLVLSVLMCSVTLGQTPTVSISPGTSASSSVVLLGDGRYDITLTTTYTNGPTTFTIAGGSATRIRNVYVDATGGNTTIIHIHGSTSGSPIAEVAAIDKLTSTDFVSLYTLRTSGDVGTIRVNRIGGQVAHVVDIGGSIVQGIEIVDDATTQETIERMTVQGDVQGNISLPSSGTILGLSILGNLGYSAAPVTVTTGKIQRLDVVGAVYASIIASGSGLIQRFTTGSSFVGSISAVHFAAVGGGATGVVIGNECRGNITLSGGIQVPLTISSALRGTVEAVSSSSNTPIVIGSIPAASGSFAEGVLRLVGTGGGAVNGGTITVNGNVAGRMELNGNIVRNVTITGQLSGTIMTTGDVGHPTPTNMVDLTINGGIASSGLVKIGGSLLANGKIKLPAQGLAGQIVINANNVGGAWAGDVVLGTGGGAITLGPGQSPPDYQSPHYAALPSALGGGSVGLAPFGIHAAACTPPHNTVDDFVELVETDFDNEAVPVIIRSYGPVGSASVDIDMRLADDCMWHPVTSMFIPVLHPGGDSRAIGLSCDGDIFMKDGILRVVPSGVTCSEVVGNPLVEWQTTDGCTSDPTFSYKFRIGPDCDEDGANDLLQIYEDDGLDGNNNGILDDCEGEPCLCDWDGNHAIEVTDIFAFLTSWFASDPRADFDGSGAVAVPDIFAFLSCWFASSNDERCNP